MHRWGVLVRLSGAFDFSAAVSERHLAVGPKWEQVELLKCIQLTSLLLFLLSNLAYSTHGSQTLQFAPRNPALHLHSPFTPSGFIVAPGCRTPGFPAASTHCPPFLHSCWQRITAGAPLTTPLMWLITRCWDCCLQLSPRGPSTHSQEARPLRTRHCWLPSLAGQTMAEHRLTSQRWPVKPWGQRHIG